MYFVWLMVSEILVHGCLTPLLWVCDEAELHGSQQKAEGNCLFHGSEEAERQKGERRKRRRERILCFSICLSYVYVHVFV